MAWTVDTEELRPDVRPLSKREIAWIERLERVLKACPTGRLHLVASGDPSLIVIDGAIAQKHDLDVHDGYADRNGLALAAVSGRPQVHAVSS